MGTETAHLSRRGVITGAAAVATTAALTVGAAGPAEAMAVVHRRRNAAYAFDPFLVVDRVAVAADRLKLALEVGAPWLLIDERDGRALATRLGLRVTGVLGVVLRAHAAGDLDAVAPLLDALRTQANFHIADAHIGTPGADVVSTNAPVQLGGGLKQCRGQLARALSGNAQPLE